MYKIVIGCVLLAAVLCADRLRRPGRAAAARSAGCGCWSISSLITIGEIYLSPISLSLYSKVAPARIVSLMMAVNFLPNFLGGGFLQGWLGTYWEKMGHPAFFLMIAAIGAGRGRDHLGDGTAAAALS